MHYHYYIWSSYLIVTIALGWLLLSSLVRSKSIRRQNALSSLSNNKSPFLIQEDLIR